MIIEFKLLVKRFLVCTSGKQNWYESNRTFIYY